ncbi:hypothetical protein EV207_11226 [Scopulibacillus darangshiensis]|uniref:Pyridoxal phosphate homeostasis protein n=1 Tax=Scopulibacillus darangshiensis TaxID=442528 RepID=A0A4R2P4U8_9BACL|nr:YggS family pyridoxal phosphate-dependent enzyme [Scopulibacillus darangshiensis]TCP29104.1 hypothetical protein EV207_11226 [Scopulibacillus darangshiensis]
MTVVNQLKNVQKNIKQACEAGERSAKNVNIIAVTKYVTEARAEEAVKAGLTHLGENRKEGLLQKQAAISDSRVLWHFIGSLQTRKVKDVISHIDYLHSLDRLTLAKEINKRADVPLKCFVQVNISGESSKHGIGEDELMAFIKALKDFSNISIVGLMTMAPHTEDQELIRRIFRRLKNWQEHIMEHGFEHAPCTELSMGMSNDYQIAVQEGATFVRIGSALVGNDG